MTERMCQSALFVDGRRRRRSAEIIGKLHFSRTSRCWVGTIVHFKLRRGERGSAESATSAIDLWNHAIRDEGYHPSRSVSLSSTLSLLLLHQPPIKISSYRTPCQSVLNFAVPAPAGRGEERISEIRAARHAPDSSPSVRFLSSSPSFSSSLLSPCPTRHTYNSLMSILVSRAHGPVARDQ